MEYFPQKNTSTNSVNISESLKDAIPIIRKGGLVITKTDTIYGILADATNRESVEKIYTLKGRELDKPFIVLIPDLRYLDYFQVNCTEKGEKILSTRGITVIFKLQDPDRFQYIHRGTKKIAFRIPDDREFLNFLQEVDKPVVAPSANPSGLEPAKNIQEAVSYFQDRVDLYVDRGEVSSNIPSTIVEVENGRIKIVRQGSKQV